MNTVCGLELLLPEHKLPGYYAQIIKGIADTVTLVDRHKTVLFVDGPEECDAIERFVGKYNVDCERSSWLQLGPDWQPNDRVFTDYGLRTREGNMFLDLALTAVVGLAPSAEPGSEFASALEQAAEHAVATHAQEDGRRLIAVDRHQVELMAGIARAYRCAFDIVAQPSSD